MSPVTNLTMPKLGLTMTEGTISEWVVSPGDSFKKNDVVLVVETEKIANEIEAPADGVLHDILVVAGETVAVGTPLANWDVGATAIPEVSAEIEEANATTHEPEKETAAATAFAEVRKNTASGAKSARIVATPLARRIALQNDIDLAGVIASGPKGRIKAEDVRAAIADDASRVTLSCGVAAASPDALPSRRAATSYEAAAARRLSEAKRDTPHFYLSTEADAGALFLLRQQLNSDNENLNISINHLIIAAVARALKENEIANCVWRDGEIVTYGTTDIGMAVSSDKGLFAPVLKDIDRLGIASIAKAARELAEKARTGQLTSDDLIGGSTTISNAGMFDVTYMGSIINPGQSSILGVGSIREIFRPDELGQPELRQEMGLVLSCDHRIFDGVSGLAFLNSIKANIEKPLRLLVS
ncbi:dihydrolipoamide acetyltransferase family protein [Sneathiella sp.]|uniref:dihydrolipoamide acetyltransferase family protein n=1 Tax=Sneathiella sp. TaxID=1964365 RepID=UPI00262E30E2|nr:dihydrolipoamide acetyltransferase family protein [Sneathiella sp.]MDF2368975.1 dihydrolipoamide acetyltransferase family protein [Sneathiella sp.]